jgi:hypothetical protein
MPHEFDLDVGLDAGRDGARVIENSRASTPAPSLAGANPLADARQSIWEQFKNSTIPRLKDLEAQMRGRRDLFITEATDSANKAVELGERQSELSREALGISLTAEQQEGQDRLTKLGAVSSQVSAQNEAVDIAGDINKSQANTLTSIQTGIQIDALDNLTGASSLKDVREGRNAGSRAGARNENLQTIGTVVGLAAML